jgi:peptide/nickel transport system substrate-binding protein
MTGKTQGSAPSMRSKMKRRGRHLVASAALLSMVAVPVASLASSSPAGAASFPKSHTLNLSFLEDPGQPPDPDVYYAGEGLLLTRNMYQGLLTYKPGTANRVIEPELATSWTISKSGLVYTFQLRQGVTFHDGTPFNSAAIAPDFARRLAVDGGPAYMVQGIKSVTTPGPYTVVITLDAPNTAFLDYLASAYGPVAESPTALAANKGSDNDQTYLETHDVGTGPYYLTESKVGVMYQMKAYPNYWGKKPYYTTINMPVIDNLSTEEIEFNDGQIAAIMHDLTTSAVNQYKTKTGVTEYNLPSLQSETAYLNENKGILESKTARLDVIDAINIKDITAGVFPGDGSVPTQAGPAHIIPAAFGKQTFPYNPSKLKAYVAKLPSSEKSFIVGYDTGAPDDQLIAEQIGAALHADGLNTKVVGYQTSSIFGWVGSTSTAASSATPNLLVDYFWPDADNPYMWTHISYDPSGGLEYLSCNVPNQASLDTAAVTTGSNSAYNKAIQNAESSGCWLNVSEKDDAMVAQSWLKGVTQSHLVPYPYTLNLATLYPG